MEKGWKERERKGRMGNGDRDWGQLDTGMEIRGGQAKRWTTRRQIWAWIDKRTENRDKWTRKKRLRRPVKGQRLGGTSKGVIDKETKIRGADVKGQNLEMDRQGDSHSSLMNSTNSH